MYWAIWESREQVSFISGYPLMGPENAAWVSQFAHVIPKSKYPKIKYLPEFVVLLTMDEHYAFDNLTDDQRRKFYPQSDWDKLYDYRDKLLETL